ncbi:hypothetical protein GCM10009332_05650 [Shewanella gelidii]|uniref:Porin n=2 Tax=Shewanella gelidii TaxID=1642821 RepID=A0A917JJK2_9GAMM|nr:hypothetical protein GCM10009332_05650 [Shewanella gelidii]
MKKTLLASTLFALFASQTAVADTETQELRKVIEQQQKVLAELERRLEQTEQRVESTADVVEQTAAKTSSTTIGGYGELHYNNIKNNLNDSTKKEFDFHRFVLFFGHEFNDTTRFFSELEVEHSLAGEGKNGEVEVEQAYIEHDFSQNASGKAGLFLMPVGIMNETHEPDTFYGVERNPVEKNVIPATWWEAGLALNYQAAPGLGFDFGVTSGLNVPTEGSKAYNIRSGRQKVSNAKGDDLAYTGRVKYTAIPGLELAASAQYQSDLTQGAASDTASAVMLTAHAIYSIEDFTVKALYAQWDIDGADAEALGRDEQNGYYIEPSYRISPEFGVFARYNEYDNAAGNSDDTKVTQTNVGLNYWLHEHVVLKADWEQLGGSKDSDGFNLGVGYQF